MMKDITKDITIQNRALIFKVTVPFDNVTRDELNDVEREFKIGTQMQLEASLGDSPKTPNTADVWCKITFNYEAAKKIPFTVDSIKSVVLSTFRNYFLGDNHVSQN